MNRAYRISMDYNEFSFEDLRQEYKEEETATWYIKSEDPVIKYVFKESGPEILDAYIYCSNMPDKLNRFVFKGKISDVTENKLESEADKRNADYKYKIVIDNIKAFDNKDASALAIRKDPDKGIQFRPQGTYGELNEKVLEILEKIEPTEDLQDFLDRFTGCNCELEGFKNDELMHSSFKKENDEKYVEFHHLIFRNFGYDDKELLKTLDSFQDNYAQLCPACHRAIHYGNKELKKEMLDKLIRNRKGKLEELYNKCLENPSFKEKINKYNPKNFKDFMYKIYGINIK